MGTFKFAWSHPADEVFVTGTFDKWSKSEKLERIGSVFEKTVALPDASEKIYYKFVVDGKWTTDHTAPQETDHDGNINNVLAPDDIVKDTSRPPIMNTVTPDSTTAALAKDVPLEKDREPIATPSDIPGGFPATPANELDKTIGINPLPATEGAVNPIKLEAGQSVPKPTEDINKHVKLDKESYEKSDALPGMGMPPISDNMIPESSLPIAGSKDVTINSVTPQSTTAALAGQVPLEPKVPAVVKESQQKAHADPEASANPEEVKEKAAMEDELKQKVPEAPVTSPAGTSIGGTVLAAAISAKDSVVEKATPVFNQASAAVTNAAVNLPDSVKQVLPVSLQPAVTTQTKEEKREEVSPEVPVEVKDSIVESGKSPEAAANTAAVEDKKAVEEELLKEVKPVPAEGEGSKKVEANGSGAAAPETPPKPVEAKNGSAPSSSTKPAESPEATVQRKKKNRLSAMFGKIKHKIGSKDK